MTNFDLEQARDQVWEALASAPLRRSILGRERCDALVRVTMGSMWLTEVAAAGPSPKQQVALRRLIERRVHNVYSVNCGFAFTTFILSWAISAIVRALIARWWKNRREVNR